MKGHMEDGKFHPHTEQKGVRKSRDQSTKTEGVKIRKQRVDVKERSTKKHISPRLIRAIDNLSGTLDRGLKDTKYNGTMAYWSELKGEADLVSKLIQEENVENEIVGAVPQDVINEALRFKRETSTDPRKDDFLRNQYWIENGSLAHTISNLEYDKKLGKKDKAGRKIDEHIQVAINELKRAKTEMHAENERLNG